MGDVDRRDPEFVLEAFQFASHLLAKLGVEIRQRFVEEEDGRLPNDGQRHALALSAAQLGRRFVGLVFDVQETHRLLDLPVAFVGRNSLDLERVGDVLRNGHMRIQRVVLEHHRDVSVAR